MRYKECLVEFSAEAFGKMNSLIWEFDTEVGWHGTVSRNENRFTVEDIIVYPQIVTPVTVDTDDRGYAMWFVNLGPEINRVRFHGHSHVTMRVRPSGVDEQHQHDLTSDLMDDDFYIFLIANKFGEWNLRVVHKDGTYLYDIPDVYVSIKSDFLDKAHKKVRKLRSAEPEIESDDE